MYQKTFYLNWKLWTYVKYSSLVEIGNKHDQIAEKMSILYKAVIDYFVPNFYFS